MTQPNNLAPLPIRGAAYLIDVITPLAGWFLFVFGIALAFGYGFGAGGDSGGPPVWLAPVFLAGVIILIGYAVWWFASLKDGQTPGKRIVGIRVVGASSGETRDLGIMLVRELLAKSILFAVIFELTPIGTFLEFFFILFLPFNIFNAFGVLGFLPLGVVFLLINFLWPIWDANSQTLHDKIVGTLVVRD